MSDHDEPGAPDGDHPTDSVDPGTADATADEEQHHESQREIRLDKIREMQEAGTNPYPFHYEPDHHVADIRDKHGDLVPGSATEDRVKVAGRLMLLRRQGGLSFATLQDRTGPIQLFVDSKKIGAERHHEFDHLDRGDWVGVEGTIMTTRRGELSIDVATFELLGKAIRPLPDKWRGLTDVDTRLRQRYVDLIANERTREIFTIRRKVLKAIRDHLQDVGFWEVEGPCCPRSKGARRRALSSPTTTRSTWTCTCGSRWNCT